MNKILKTAYLVNEIRVSASYKNMNLCSVFDILSKHERGLCRTVVPHPILLFVTFLDETYMEFNFKFVVVVAMQLQAK